MVSVALQQASIPLSAGETCIPQADGSYLPYTPTVWSGVWPVCRSSSASQVY